MNGQALATAGLERRLLLLLLLPFGLVGVVGSWFQYQAAGTAAVQQDQRLLRLAPMLGDSVLSIIPPADEGASGLMLPEPVLLLAPPVEEFLSGREGTVGHSILSTQGQLLLGDAWLPTVLPATTEPEFLSMTEGGVTYRIVAQRVTTPSGDLIVLLADGTDPGQHWLDTVTKGVLLPNLVLMVLAALGVRWAVSRALRPLVALKKAVEHRSPRDLSPIADEGTPAEVQPLVHSLNRLFALVNAQAEAQRRFVADAAHQLRTPLAALQAQTEAWGLAARALRPDEVMALRVEQVLRLRTAARRTTQLANQLLALSRADSTPSDPSAMQCVDLKELCETVLALHLDAAAARHTDLGLAAEPAQVSGHAWLLRELLINLVDNAIKHTPAHGCVTVRCGPGGSSGPLGAAPGPWLAVEDSGPGIAPAERERVLQRFYRVPGTATEGNGLGLAIAHEIARAHGTQLHLGPATTGPEGERGLRVAVFFTR